jgi:hypothetical protein
LREYPEKGTIALEMPGEKRIWGQA